MNTTTTKLVTCSDCFRQFHPDNGVYIKRRVGSKGGVAMRFVCRACQSRRRMEQMKKLIRP